VAGKEEYEHMMKHNVFQEVPRDEVPEGVKTQLMEIFECDAVGNMDEYVGSKIDRGDDEKRPYLKIAQPVLLQSYDDGSKLPEG
jgi:hypothetical protein